ncbi:MAG TPA: hypothetical protein DCZ48_07295, partial [Methylococcaceae bacterium]|nr:hypothetical protein [Methylococcaceae bacterium]
KKLANQEAFCPRKSRKYLISYTFRTSNFGSALGGAGVLFKGFASMDVFTAPFDGHPGAEF